MADDQAPWNTILRGLVDGDGQAYAEFWDQYGERLNRIANRHLPRQLHRRVQPEDVVQSVCRTFFRRMSEGRLKLGKNDQLWPLLCAITLNKVRMQIRFQLAGKRHVAREVRLGQGSTSHGGGIQPQEVPGDDIDPQEAAAFAEQLERVLAKLDEEERQVVQLRLDGYGSQEIAERLQCCTRTVRRITSLMRERLRQDLLSDLGLGDDA